MLVLAILAGGVVELHGMATIGRARTGMPITGTAKIGMATITTTSSNHHFNNRFAAGLGWWPGYYNYGYGYGGCSWLRRQALITGSPYWWDRYYACVNYY